MWKDLQSYKERTGANVDYIEKQERRLATLMGFFRAADAAILEAEEERAQAYHKGIQKARNQIEDILPPCNFFDKEDHRSYSIHQARIKWPELY